LDALTHIGKVSLASLGIHLQMDAKQLRPALDRILALGYGISRDADGDDRWYAAVRQPAL
jgi:hypothetical protein